MRGGIRAGAGRKPKPDSNVCMYFLRVSVTLKAKLAALTTTEARQALENAAEKKLENKC